MQRSKCSIKPHWTYALSIWDQYQSPWPQRKMLPVSRSNKRYFQSINCLVYFTFEPWLLLFLAFLVTLFLSLLFFLASIISKLSVIPCIKSGLLLWSRFLLRGLGPPVTTQAVPGQLFRDIRGLPCWADLLWKTGFPLVLIIFLKTILRNSTWQLNLVPPYAKMALFCSYPRQCACKTLGWKTFSSNLDTTVLILVSSDADENSNGSPIFVCPNFQALHLPSAFWTAQPRTRTRAFTL